LPNGIANKWSVCGSESPVPLLISYCRDSFFSQMQPAPTLPIGFVFALLFASMFAPMFPARARTFALGAELPGQIAKVCFSVAAAVEQAQRS
jgi:hypothetical protein